jgi:hypothetical protein
MEADPQPRHETHPDENGMPKIARSHRIDPRGNGRYSVNGLRQPMHFDALFAAELARAQDSDAKPC